MKYCVDTSFLLDAWRRKYPPEHFPPFWEYLDRLISSGDVKAPEEVFYDIKKKDDEVLGWAEDRKKALFVPIDYETQQEVSAILKRFEFLMNQRKSRSSSDPWVIALAKINSSTVITNEVLSTNLNPQKPKIPDVCVSLGIRYIDTLKFIKEERLVFNSFIIR